MSGINYDLTRIRGIVMDVDGVLSPSTIPTDADGMPVRMMNVKDGYAIQLAVKCGFRLAIISGGNTESVRKRYTALGLSDVFQGVAHKIETFNKWMADNGMNREEVIYIGDDIPDLKCLRAAGLPCCPYDACSEVRTTAAYISPAGGGYGCVRDILEQVLKANNLWLNDANAFGW